MLELNRYNPLFSQSTNPQISAVLGNTGTNLYTGVKRTKNDTKTYHKTRVYKRLAIVKKHLPESKCAVCGTFAPVGFTITGLFTDSDNTPSVAGTNTCKDKIICPRCSAEINTGQAREILEVAALFRKAGYAQLFGTATIRHSAGVSFSDMKRLFSNVTQSFKNSREFREFKIRYKAEYVERKELRISRQNGYHIHSHSLFFVGGKLDDIERRKLELRLKNAWLSACQSVGAYASPEYGYKLQGGKEAERYLTKLEYEAELSGEDTKTGRGLTVLQLIDLMGNGDRWAYNILKDIDEGGARFRTINYSRGKEMKGKRKEARVRVNIADRAEQAERELSQRYVFCLSSRQWSKVVEAGKRADLLEVMSTTKGNHDKVWEFLQSECGIVYDQELEQRLMAKSKAERGISQAELSRAENSKRFISQCNKMSHRLQRVSWLNEAYDLLKIYDSYSV